MSIASQAAASLRHADRFFIGGEWVKPSSDAAIKVIDSTNEEVFLTVAEAQADDISRAVGAARTAFDQGPWASLSHAERAGYLRAIADGLRERATDLSQVWPREAGALYSIATGAAEGAAQTWEYYAGLADTYPFEELATPSIGEFGLIVREPVGVVGAIIPWNGPLGLISYKLAPALLAGCTVVLKNSPEAPAEGYVLAEIAESIGLPPGVINVVTADRAVSELLVRDPRVDKITFTGSTAAGRRIASICGERIARVHPGTGRQVRGRHPGRRGHRHHRGHPGRGRVHAVRPGLLLADPDRGHPQPARRDARGAGQRVRRQAGR